MMENMLHRWATALALLAYVLAPFPAGASPNAEGEQKSRDERKTILRVPETLVTAWNRNDMDTIAKLFLPDAVLVTPMGAVIRSRSAIRKQLVDERRGKLKETTLHHSVEDVSILTGATALVKGKYQLEGMKPLGIETSPQGSFVFRQRKNQGRWMISRAEILRQQNE